MLVRYSLILLLALCLINFPALADSRLGELLRGSDVTPALSGLQVSLMERGHHTESFAYGFAQLKKEGPVALRTDHKVRVASVSKLLVAIGIMQLVEASLLDLDEDVSSYLGWTFRNPAFPEQKISARQLLSHTSSVRDGPRYFIRAGQGELRDFFDPHSGYWDDGSHFAKKSGQKPGRYFYYANLNFGLLGELLERLSRRRFDQYMATRVLDPLGLSARFSPCDIPASQLASTYRKGDGEGNWNPEGPWVSQVDGVRPSCFYGAESLADAQGFLERYRPGSNASLFSPQGGLRASADDLIQVMRMLVNEGVLEGRRILKPQSIDVLLRSSWTINSTGNNGNTSGEAEPGGSTDGLMASYGLSVHRIDMRAWGFADGPTLLVGHLGEAYGVLSHALFDPESGDGIATIITGTAADPASSPAGHSPLYRVEEEVLRWWLSRE
ncbi:MAG: serine hydrolase domain-containing protein [Pseudomonadota bacterium]